MTSLHTLIAVATMALVPLAANSALHERGNGMVYDDAQNLTWLKDWNLPMTQGLSATGQLTWAQARDWAADLTVGGYTDWRLPAMTHLGNPDCAEPQYICDGTLPDVRTRLDTSELSHLWFIDVGVKPMRAPITGEIQQDWGVIPPGAVPMFDNLTAHGDYWLADSWLGQNQWSWGFNLAGGDVGPMANWDASMHAVAVRSGDVLSAVPELPSSAMLWLGLVVLAAMRRQVLQSTTRAGRQFTLRPAEHRSVVQPGTAAEPSTSFHLA